jgi:integrase
MANVNFRPNKGKTVKDPTKPQKIYVRYWIGRKVDFNASTGISVLMDDWDIKNERIKNRSHIKNRLDINSRLSNLKKHFEDFESNNLNDGIIPTYDQVKKHFDSFFKKADQTTPERPTTFFEFIESFIHDANTKPNRHTVNHSPVKSGTIRSYSTAYNLFKRYNDEVQRFDFEDIDMNFYNSFSNWCDNLGFKKGYKGKNIKTLKVFMNSAVRNGITTNVKFRDSDFVTVRETADSIYLSLDQLTAIWQLDLTNKPTMERARDLFLIGCFTGLRVSDFNNLKPSSIREINGLKILVVKTQKTNKTVAIPLHPIVDAIFTKYNGIPKRMQDQNINEIIKKVARLTGIIEPIETTATIGGLEVTQTKEKCDLVSNHTGRRSFCTNAYLSGMDSLDIMAISGHTSEKDFLKYIKVTPEQRAVKMSKTKFFTNATALKVG